ncbi:MAG: hypothetical protein AB8G26_05045 [Ilumatobacter sp.]
MLRRVGDLQAHRSSLAEVPAGAVFLKSPMRRADVLQVTEMDMDAVEHDHIDDGSSVPVLGPGPTLPAFPTGPLGDVNEVAVPALVLTGMPQRLVPAAPFRIGMILTNLACFPLAFIALSTEGDDRSVAFFALAAIAPAISLLCAVVWSGIAAVNAGRVRPQGRYHRRPSALNATLSWLAPIVVPTVLAYVGVTWSEELRAARSSLADSDGEMLIVAAGAFLAFLLLLAAYRPYSVLRRLSRWVGGEQKRFRNWFLAPFAGAAAGLSLVAVSALLADDDVTSRMTDARTGLSMVALAMPWVCWLVAGNRAMADLESSTRTMQDRLRRDAVWVSADSIDD